MVSVFMITSFLLFSLVVLSLNLGTKEKSSEETSQSFECGIDSWGGGHTPFSLRYYILAVIFLIFEFEVIIFFPFLAKSEKVFSTNWENMLLMFFFFLYLGVVVEWASNSIYWK